MARQPTRLVDQARLRQIVDDVVTPAGYDLEGCSAKLVGRRFLVRIAVDCDEGIDLDGVADLSRRILARFDEIETTGTELIPGEYELEVGSPGVDRPLTAPRHWRRNRGRLVRVQVAGLGTVVGRVVTVDEDGVTLDLDGAARRASFSELGKGRVEIEFSRPGEEFEVQAVATESAEGGEEAIDDEGGDEE
jgi:ribosome maturation factor RimP